MKGLKLGASVVIEFVERQPGEWVITSVQSSPKANPATSDSTKSSAHSGH
jgi:hypothetical protein